ncbi:MAG TPA: MBL fold metallo-hydrolase [Candidatus Ozemobacteraceae bacterium]|nr:MBL fold metallo-hydrolase [Candidatus Ozemobacteraceae bacterium]
MSKQYQSGKIIIECFTLGPLDVNTYLAYDPETGDGIIIDPAENDPALLKRLEELAWKTARIFLTHGHADHIAGLEAVRSATGAAVFCSQEDAPMLGDARLNLSMFLDTAFTARPPDRIIRHGDEITLGRETGTVISLPGHTPGGVALAFRDVIFSGDALFAGSIGRSDFPGGNGAQLVSAIKDRLLPLGDRLILPGHGPATRLAHEAAHNPFLSDDWE